MLTIVIEISMEQTRLFRCTMFHYAENSSKDKHSGTTYADFNREFNYDFKHNGTPLK